MSWEQLQSKPKGSHLSIDGFYRTEQKERELNTDMATLFNSEIGKKVLDYLRSITVDAVAGKDVSNEHLRHLEGMRYLYFIVKRRIESDKEV
ncbi:hypothetical protein [uncultured Mediterranean phage uvMED]|jgi:hypothetical protein|nr:hypothetical protein [uncultured Mediterranean phage uvMED]BAQ86753.1 hypothetical protein [uncultured Mediterranean phage uvMED]